MTVTADPLVRNALSGRTRRGNPREHDARLSAAVPFPVAIVASAIAGGMLDLGYPAYGWWPATFVSVTIGLWTLRGRSLPRAFLISLVYGAAFYFTHLVWVSRFLGPIPWVALAGLESLLFGAGGALIALAYRVATTRARHGYRAITPVLVAGVWVLRETLMGSTPYTGFPWARVGFSLAESPLAEAASWVGTTGLSFLTVLVCASVVEALILRRWEPAAAAAVIVVAATVVPLFPTEQAGMMRVGWVQGNGPSGYFDTRTTGDIMRAQEEATAPLLDREMDLLVWPEGAVDADPLRDVAVAGRLDRLVQGAGAPALVNAATTRGADTFNTSMLWTSAGPQQLHDKANPVPFGEYVPDRWFYEAIAPDLIGLIQREYTPGSNTPLVNVGDVPIGLAICFDVIYDDVIHQSAASGAQMFVFQTNNADFRGTDENLQQLAIARMRAIETGRTAVNVSTTGTSQVIGRDGQVLAQVAVDTTAAKITEVPLRTGTTLAVVLMPWLDWTLSIGTVLALLIMSIRQRRSHADAQEDGWMKL
ncbi:MULTISPECIES: apolipoprotein N-acyltransferase [Microbacterium]|uniref:Apolipoprotein N-acyltransferase n=1 Tax=Microbacterium maritypicum TaxID=33918 RepID=A0ACD4B8B9_MICMQ|nr:MULTISPECIES: apolipoprotein N-acyltransferase [Microbacterium]AZS46088.1 Apolipoprotein N-acyltransferase [Microbacterium oxydans]UTT53606.1 apolipoprotein N-acyltransferase [Microbacterium liquefaciens]WKT87721.1 apolipoprotein N-acyltransferase [Microbacterium liquefaciens]